MNFSEIGLGPEVLRAVEDAGYTQPTPIQEQAIPWVLQGRDVLGCAQTGTGKTASFTLPFDVLVMFSTNLHPADLMDAAFLPRIQYKIKLFEPTRDEYRQVFSAVAQSRGLEFSEEVFDMSSEC